MTVKSWLYVVAILLMWLAFPLIVIGGIVLLVI